MGGRGSKDKKPRTRYVPPQGATARTAKSVVKPGPERGEDHPTFSFRHADTSYTGSWSWPEGDACRELLDFLCQMSLSTWTEIKAQECGGRNRHRKHHSQGLATLCPEAQKRVADLHLDERFEEEVFRFRLAGTKRLWGFLVEGVFYVLWWDADHQVYPV